MQGLREQMPMRPEERLQTGHIKRVQSLNSPRGFAGLRLHRNRKALGRTPPRVAESESVLFFNGTSVASLWRRGRSTGAGPLRPATDVVRVGPEVCQRCHLQAQCHQSVGPGPARRGRRPGQPRRPLRPVPLRRIAPRPSKWPGGLRAEPGGGCQGGNGELRGQFYSSLTPVSASCPRKLAPYGVQHRPLRRIRCHWNSSVRVRQPRVQLAAPGITANGGPARSTGNQIRVAGVNT
jgi:hypothetical protein